MKEEKLIRKLRISGMIVVKTGLHIGGSKGSLNIGGMDMPVIKTPFGVPYIPGSSLRGKLRAMVARLRGTKTITTSQAEKNNLAKEMADEEHEDIRQLFGLPADAPQKNFGITRLVVRDATLSTDAWNSLLDGRAESTNEIEDEWNWTKIQDDKQDRSLDGELLETRYTENKAENFIDRINGVANPRQLERVPAGAIFNFEMFYNSFDLEDEIKEVGLLLQAMRLLQDDYLGGHGSRGSGQIEWKGVVVRSKTPEDYTQNTLWKAAKIQDQYKF